MRIDRRTMIKGTAGAGALAGIASPQAASALGVSSVIFYDSRIPESQAFARDLMDQARLFDIATADENRWALVRGELPSAASIEGLTGWNDWVLIRGELEQRGWRFGRDDKVAAPLSGKAHLIRWSLKPRG